MRLKVATVAAVWLFFFAAVEWATIRRHYVLSALLGFLSGPVGGSVMMRAVTGRWPDWRGAWKMFLKR